jgi:hypothetical protein
VAFDLTLTGIVRNGGWKTVTERDSDRVDPRGAPIDLVLTPRDRDIAAQAAVHLEANRRRHNRADTAQAAAHALSRAARREGVL